MALVAGTSGPQRPDKVDLDRIPVEVERDRWDRPLILQPDGTKVAYTRASTLGDAIEDHYAIEIRNQRMLVFGLGHSRPLFLEAAAVATTETPADKKALSSIAKRSMTAAGADDLATVGTALHGLTEQIDHGRTIPDVGEDRYALDAYVELMTRFRVLRTETFVAHDDLQAAGTFDKELELLVDFTTPDGEILPAGTIVCGDVKTAQTDKYFGVKFAVQFVVYQGGKVYNLATGERTAHRMHPRWALIIYMPSGGAMAELQWVDLEQGREFAELAVRIREARKRASSKAKGNVRLVTPILPDELPGPPPLHVQADALQAQVMGGLDEPRDDLAGLHCAECIEGDEDPLPWCDCGIGGPDETCSGPCRKRAHEPARCPRGPAMVQMLDDVRARNAQDLAATCGPVLTPARPAWLPTAAEVDRGDWDGAAGMHDPMSIPESRDAGGMDEFGGPPLPGDPGYCSDCDYDTHRCQGCGDDVPHELGRECAKCKAEHDAEAAPLAAPAPLDTIGRAIAGARSPAALEALWSHFRVEWRDVHTAAVRARLVELQGTAVAS